MEIIWRRKRRDLSLISETKITITGCEYFTLLILAHVLVILKITWVEMQLAIWILVRRVFKPVCM